MDTQPLCSPKTFPFSWEMGKAVTVCCHCHYHHVVEEPRTLPHEVQSKELFLLEKKKTKLFLNFPFFFFHYQIPKGFPYFSVDFGLQGGYATVIEDESRFPVYFGRVGSPLAHEVIIICITSPAVSFHMQPVTYSMNNWARVVLMSYSLDSFLLFLKISLSYFRSPLQISRLERVFEFQNLLIFNVFI